MLSVDTELRK